MITLNQKVTALTEKIELLEDKQNELFSVADQTLTVTKRVHDAAQHQIQLIQSSVGLQLATVNKKDTQFLELTDLMKNLNTVQKAHVGLIAKLKSEFVHLNASLKTIQSKVDNTIEETQYINSNFHKTFQYLDESADSELNVARSEACQLLDAAALLPTSPDSTLPPPPPTKYFPDNILL